MDKKGQERFMELSVLLRELRLANGITQSEVARALGLASNQYVSNWERALSAVPISKIKTLAELYKVHVDVFKIELLKIKINDLDISHRVDIN